MGVNFTHCDAGWSYSGFHRFRQRLAEAVGINDLDDMAGFRPLFYDQQNPTEHPNLSWQPYEDDPIRILLNHSDCDGELTPDECRAVWPRLREMVKDWPEGDYDRIKALELSDGMLLAATLDEPLEFC